MRNYTTTRDVTPQRPRKTVQLLPSASFTPSIEEIRRLAAAVSAGAPFVRRVLGINEPVVIRLWRRAPGPIEYLIDLPARFAHQIRHHAFMAVDVIEAPPEQSVPPERRYSVAAEMILRRPALMPLPQLPLRPDPKDAMCRAMDDLEPGEEAEVAVALSGADWA